VVPVVAGTCLAAGGTAVVCVAWDTLGIETVDSLCHALFEEVPSAVGAVYLAGAGAGPALAAVSLCLEWLHPKVRAVLCICPQSWA
jgi:hypothetical protein